LRQAPHVSSYVRNPGAWLTRPKFFSIELTSCPFQVVS
jgi:hypothetical protein